MKTMLATVFHGVIDIRVDSVPKPSAQGIDSISLNPDTVLKTTLAILKTEGSLG